MQGLTFIMPVMTSSKLELGQHNKSTEDNCEQCPLGTLKHKSKINEIILSNEISIQNSSSKSE